MPEIAVFVCSFIKRGSPSIPPTVAILCSYRFPLHGFFAFTVKGDNATSTLFKVTWWKQTAEVIGRQHNVADALRHSCGLDKRFAPLEEHVMEAVFAYDEMIGSVPITGGSIYRNKAA